MPGIGDLVVNLSANTQKFDNNISKSQVGLKDFASSAVSLLNPVTASLVAMAGAAVGVGAAVWGLQGRIGDLAGVADKAAQTGLSGAFLQRLEFAADQSGVSAETLTGGIKKLTVMIGKAAEGGKEASEALSSLGLSADDLKKLSPEQQFLKISQKIGEIPTAAGKAAAAVKIFGKSGIEMTTLFAGGLDDITTLMQDAKDIGIGLDDKSLAQVAEADDALQKMYASIGAMVDQVAVGLAPAFTLVAEEVTSLIGPVTKLFATFNSMEGKWNWLGDTIVAAFDVGIETIKIHWAEMLEDLIDDVVNFGVDIKDIGEFQFDITNPLAMGWKVGNKPPREQGLQQAKGRLDGLLGQFQGAGNAGKPGADPGFNRPWTELKPPKSFTEAWAGITDALSPITSQLEAGANGFIDRAKIQADALAGTLTGWLGTDRKKQDMTPKLAGAMSGGSVDAYSTIVQAMMTRGNVPVVAATEKQTKDLIKGLKPKREFKNIDSFVSL